MDQLRPVLGRAGVDALWVSAPANVRWLSGFTSAEDGKVLVSPDGATLYTDARYTVQAQEESSLPQYIARPPPPTSTRRTRCAACAWASRPRA